MEIHDVTETSSVFCTLPISERERELMRRKTCSEKESDVDCDEIR